MATTKSVYEQYTCLSRARGVNNGAVTGTQTGQPNINIGHNFPYLKLSDSARLKEEMNQARIFIDDSKDQLMSERIWTLESRDKFSDIQMESISFHRAFAIINKEFRLLPDYQELFRQVGIAWILD